jgi:hypothetical protein
MVDSGISAVRSAKTSEGMKAKRKAKIWFLLMAFKGAPGHCGTRFAGEKQQ